MTVDVSVLGKPITFRNGMKAPNVFLKVSSSVLKKECHRYADHITPVGSRRVP